MVHFPIPIKWKCNCSHEEEGWGGGPELKPLPAAHPPLFVSFIPEGEFSSALKLFPLPANEAIRIII